MKWKFDPIFPL